MYYSTTYLSPLGPLLLASVGENIVGLWNENQKYFGATIAQEMVVRDDLAVFKSAKTWLDQYFSGDRPLISDLPLAPTGGDFRKAVWEILCQIPYGEYITYGEIAKKMAIQLNMSKISAQAIGGAVGHNPISIIIPCHRVVGVNGSLTGYAGGIAKKIKLLEHEGADMSSLFVPSKGTAL